MAKQPSLIGSFELSIGVGVRLRTKTSFCMIAKLTKRFGLKGNLVLGKRVERELKCRR